MNPRGVQGPILQINNVNDSTLFYLSLSLIVIEFACTGLEKDLFEERVFPVKSDLGET